MKSIPSNNFASLWPKMYDIHSRQTRAVRIIKTLGDLLGGTNLKKLNVLDLGCSTGIIDSVLSDNFKEVWGIDTDEEAIRSAKKEFKKGNLHFQTGSALDIKLKPASFDIVICTHIYEHVANPAKLFKEIYRIIKPGGACYLAAINAIWPIEPHYKLPFLSWLPKNIANFYVKIFGKSQRYYESPLFYWQLKKLVRKFKVVDYTPKVLSDPQKFGYTNPRIPKIFADYLRFFTPTLFWLLIKRK